MDFQRNIILAPYTTFHIGGPADYFVVVKSQEEIIEAVKFAKEKKLKYFILGTGANILVGDKGFRGVVIKNEASAVTLSEAKGLKKYSSPSVQNDIVQLTVDSGTTIEKLIKFTAEKGLSGLEHFAGIPSSVGGALWQNLHFLSPDRTKTVFIGDILEEAVIYSSSEQSESRSFRQARTVNVSWDYFKFDYDYSILHDNNDIVLSATFNLIPEDPKIIQERIDTNLKWRKEKHPENAVNTSAGSIFKKIEGFGAGRLIEKAGLKGYQIGGAKISEKHANFIVNTGNARSQDVRELIELVKKTVKEKLGLDMQPEISFIGEF